MILQQKLRKKLFSILAAIFILMNLVAIFHSYKFTHFTNDRIVKTSDPHKFSTADKIKTVLLGVDNPRPENSQLPKHPYKTVRLKSNKEIECWYIEAENSKGTVLLFHGFSGEKSSLLGKADIFKDLGYNTLLVDFMGSGGSEGNQTTIGYKEAEEVKTCFDYVKALGEQNIYMFGTSMGAVAIMKSINDYELAPNAIILECPFGTMYKTVCARFKTMKLPTIPMAGLLVFWGGVQNGFWAFRHNPTEYALSINCPALLFYGEKDEKVSRQEITDIYTNLNGRKQLITYPLAGHDDYFTTYKKDWVYEVGIFMNQE